MNVVAAMPSEAKVKPIRAATGTAITTHADSTMPMAAIVMRNAVA